MRWSWRVELPQWLVMSAMFAAAAWAWPQVPERIPVHWGLNGEVDRYGGKFEGLLAIPLTVIGIYLLMLVPFFSATIRPAFFRMLKWPDSVDRASGNRSAISPAVIARLRSSRRISRRVGSLRA